VRGPLNTPVPVDVPEVHAVSGVAEYIRDAMVGSSDEPRPLQTPLLATVAPTCAAQLVPVKTVTVGFEHVVRTVQALHALQVTETASLTRIWVVNAGAPAGGHVALPVVMRQAEKPVGGAAVPLQTPLALAMGTVSHQRCCVAVTAALLGTAVPGEQVPPTGASAVACTLSAGVAGDSGVQPVSVTVAVNALTQLSWLIPGAALPASVPCVQLPCCETEHAHVQAPAPTTGVPVDALRAVPYPAGHDAVLLVL
jgi:hypothetical protein